jgi:hypothetical protein
MSWSNPCRPFAVAVISAASNSAGMLSIPAALLFFVFFIAFFISSTFISSMLMSSSS